MHSQAKSIVAYITAKDGNRPHLLDAAFTENATVRMLVQTQSISFPPALDGREAIAEILVRRFNQTHENIYTFCIGAPPAADAEAFTCGWLVAMSEKQGGAVRVGCGHYDWSFARDNQKVNALTISIETMETLPPDALAPVMSWISALPYPWCSQQAAIESAPGIAGVSHVLQLLRAATSQPGLTAPLVRP